MRTAGSISNESRGNAAAENDGCFTRNFFQLLEGVLFVSLNARYSIA